MLLIYNTLSQEKEIFKPIHPGKIDFYVCGITVYDYCHIGHARVYLVFDTIIRYLRYRGFEVNYIRNITDIDDKIIKRADENQEPMEILTERFINAMHEDFAALNIEPATLEPRATEYVPQMITLIKTLMDKGYAYVGANGDVYYKVEKFESYGCLSHRKMDDLQAGARIGINESKQHPFDFVLWKSAKVGEPSWASPWGPGRPGWHIECSAMAHDYLGKHIDLHGGGMDLIFPHHENEIAQSEGLFGSPFSTFWIHNAFVRINQEKMSKSLNNFFTLRDVFAQFDPMVVRFYYLQHHYRGPLDFSFEGLEAAQKAYQKLCATYGGEYGVIIKEDFKDNTFFNELMALIGDDLNTVGAIGLLFSQQEQDFETRAAGKLFLQSVLGLSLKPLPKKTIVLTPEIERLITEREAARIAKDWKKSDALRTKLIELGYEVQDGRS